MISICTVTLNCLKPFEDVFLKSVAKKTTQVDEVIFCNNNLEKGFYSEQKMGSIMVKTYGTGIKRISSFGHALGLHQCLAHAKNDHVLLSDPDLFFYTNTDEIFLNLMEKYNLFAVGVSSDCPPILAQTFFPFIHCVLLRKSLLPDINFLAGCTRIEYLEATDRNFITAPHKPLNGLFLMPGAIKEYWREFPNPKGSFDTSCNLWLWCKQKDFRWMSFQTMDRFTYNLNLYRTNFKLRDKLGNDKLLYHIVSGTKIIKEQQDISGYLRLWREIEA